MRSSFNDYLIQRKIRNTIRFTKGMDRIPQIGFQQKQLNTSELLEQKKEGLKSPSFQILTKLITYIQDVVPKRLFVGLTAPVE